MESILGHRLKETKHHMGVLAEGLRHDVQPVAEALRNEARSLRQEACGTSLRFEVGGLRPD